MLHRFRNKALGDTVYRVGSDLTRKLGKNDRIVGAIRLAQKNECKFDRILEVLAYGFLFRATDEFNSMFPDDEYLASRIDKNMIGVFTDVCGFDLTKDVLIINTLKDFVMQKIN